MLRSNKESKISDLMYNLLLFLVSDTSPFFQLSFIFINKNILSL